MSDNAPIILTHLPSPEWKRYNSQLRTQGEPSKELQRQNSLTRSGYQVIDEMSEVELVALLKKYGYETE
jgi:hypothetical protein